MEANEASVTECWHAGYTSLMICRMVVGLGEASFVSLASPLIGIQYVCHVHITLPGHDVCTPPLMADNHISFIFLLSPYCHDFLSNVFTAAPVCCIAAKNELVGFDTP